MLQWTAPQLLIFGMLLVFGATTIGAFPILFVHQMTDRTKSFFLGISGGIMLGATVFSLIGPALDLYEESGMHPFSAASLVGCEMIIGALLLYGFHQLIPHEHLLKHTEHSSEKISRQTLVLLAVALHNLPEGLAVGVGLGSGQQSLGLTISLAIALQDFPEGLIVALGMYTLGFNYKKIFLITAATGLVEAVGVPFGYFGVQIAQMVLPLAFALCAGAMLFVISHEVIPESHRNNAEKFATGGIMLGFVIMMILDRGLSTL